MAGTLLPRWSWASHPELYSGKHKTTGMNVQVACTLDGNLAWISDAVSGSRHDSYCLSESGALATFEIGGLDDLCVPRMSSVAVTSSVALRAVRP